ncbi:MAG: hypothetical protein IIB38_07875, partial [Candidatus Hydrogenedentes bacterium]|nr:hypothetical protein [Candidatus Hydrogenedentota bacterium]
MKGTMSKLRVMTILAVSLACFGNAAGAVSITFSIEDNALYTYFAGNPYEITVQAQDRSATPTTLELEPGVPVTDFLGLMRVTTGDWPGCCTGLTETQTIHYSVNVGSESAQLSQVVKADWIGNNQAMFTISPAVPAAVVLDLGATGVLTITPSPDPILFQTQANSGAGALIGATFLLEVAAPIAALIDIDPDTLNTNSHGQWITAFITLPEGFAVSDIDHDSIQIQSVIGSTCGDLEASLPADVAGFTPQEGDRDEDDIADLTVKFDRQLLLSMGLCED